MRDTETAAAFECLQLHAEASAEEAKAAFRTLVRAHHPDKHSGDTEVFQELNRSYKIVLRILEHAAPDAPREVVVSEGNPDNTQAAVVDPNVHSVEHATFAQAEGNVAYAAGDFTSAVDLYTKALAWGEDAVLYSNRSAARAKLQRWEEALQDAQQAVQLRSRWVKGHIRCAEAFVGLRQLQSAADSYRRALELQPGKQEVKAALHLLEAALARQCCKFVLQGHKGAVYSLAFSPQVLHDPVRLATCSQDCTVKLWSPTSGRLLATLEGHTDQVTEVAWSTKGPLLASASLDTTARLWWLDDSSRCSSATVLSGHEGRITNLQFAAGGNQLITGSTDRTVRVWSTETCTCISTFTGHEGIVPSIALAPGGRLLASASGDGSCRLWELATGECVHNIAWGSGGVNLCAFTPAHAVLQGRCFLTTCHIDKPREEGRVLMWDVEGSHNWVDNKLEGYCKHFEGFRGKIEGLDFCITPDGEAAVMATGCQDGTVRVVDIATETTQFELADQHSSTDLDETHSFLPAQPAVHIIKFSLDGRLLATSGSDNKIKVWDTESGVIMHTLAGHKAKIRSVVWSPAGKQLASAAMDNTCRIWQLPEQQQTGT